MKLWNLIRLRASQVNNHQPLQRLYLPLLGLFQLGDHDKVLFGSILSTKCKSICQVVQGDKVCSTEIIWKASDKPQSTSEGCAPCSIQRSECTLFQGCGYSKDMIILKMWLFPGCGYNYKAVYTRFRWSCKLVVPPW